MQTRHRRVRIVGGHDLRIGGGQIDHVHANRAFRRREGDEFLLRRDGHMIDRAVHVLDDLQELHRARVSAPEQVNAARRGTQNNVVGRCVQAVVLLELGVVGVRMCGLDKVARATLGTRQRRQNRFVWMRESVCVFRIHTCYEYSIT